MHTIAEECTIEQIVCEVDRKTKTESKVKFLKSYSKARVVIRLNMVICAEKSDSGIISISRFTLRDEGR
jgi:translation elongation factor EF-1alpha